MCESFARHWPAPRERDISRFADGRRRAAHAKGDAVARSAGMMQALETGRCVIAGNLAEFEVVAVQWQAGQHQPDQLAAAVIAFDVLAPTAGQAAVFVAPDLTRRISDRPGFGADRRSFGQPAAIMAPDGRMTRQVKGGNRYDPPAPHLRAAARGT
jgi:hypothetical protein